MSLLSIQNIQRYMLYCMGEGYFDRRRYNEDLAVAKREERFFIFQQDTETKRQTTQMLKPMDWPGMRQAYASIQAVLNGIGIVVQAILQPFQLAANQIRQWVQQAQQQMQQMQAAMARFAQHLTQPLEGPMSNIFSYFFGFKKHRIEENELRDKDEFAQTDLFTRFVVRESQEYQQSGGRQ